MDEVADSAPEEMAQMDKISIILEEYKMLRTEIQNRNGYGFQITVVALAALTWIFSKADLSLWASYIPILSVFIISFWMWRINVRDIWRAAARLREIEHDVNVRSNDRLLVWEQRFGVARGSYLASLLHNGSASPESDLPPLLSSDKAPVDRDSHKVL